MIELKDMVICYKCQKVHRKKPLRRKEEARCSNCDTLLYKNINGLEYRIFSYSITALMLFAISMIYPVIDINLAGSRSLLNIPETIFLLFESGYLLVSFFALMVLVIFPFIVMFLLFVFSIFVIIRKNSNLTKSILKLLESFTHWSMLDIFFVSILVAMVKIFDYALIEFDVGFVSLIFFIMIELYLTRHIYIESLWDLWEDRYAKV
jgi:paraquat-inducible protein A